MEIADTFIKAPKLSTEAKHMMSLDPELVHIDEIWELLPGLSNGRKAFVADVDNIHMYRNLSKLPTFRGRAVLPHPTKPHNFLDVNEFTSVDEEHNAYGLDTECWTFSDDEVYCILVKRS